MPEPRSRTLVFTIILAGAGWLYFVTLRDGLEALRGAISKGVAFELLFSSLALWSLLAILLAIGGTRGSMPTWTARLAIPAVPLAGIAAFVADSMYWAPHRWTIIIFPALLPLLVAFFAIWARSPWLQSKLPARSTSLVVWILTLVLSLTPLMVELML